MGRSVAPRLARASAAALGLVLLLAACDDSEPLLPGPREDVRASAGPTIIAAAARGGAEGPAAIALAPPRRLPDWPLRVGNASNDPGHATLRRAPVRIWSADIGRGDTRRQRIVADPVSDGARVYTLDARATVSATTTGGATVWRRSLVPASDRATDASGGGVGVADGTVYVTTGFGELHALDAATGATRWVQALDAPLATPKPVGGTVYVVSRDARGWAIDAVSGRVRWDLAAAPAGPVSATAPAPAVAGDAVIFPFGGGDVVAVDRTRGERLWTAGVLGRRIGVAYNDVGDITGDPVVADGRVVLGTTSGRIVALDRATGARAWTATEGAVSPVVVAGGAVFAVTDRAQLIRLDASSGAVVWRTDLPFHEARRLVRRDAVVAHFGPVLAGGLLWVASSDGAVRGFDPATGRLASTAPVPGGAASRPMPMQDALFVVGRRGALHAFR